MITKEEKIWIFIIVIAAAFYILYLALDAGDDQSVIDSDTGNSTPMSTSSNPLQLFANAIAKEEGFFAKGSSQNIPQRANNPLDLEEGDIGYGTIAAAGGQQITVFPTLSAGWAAALKKLGQDIAGTKNYPAGESISQFMQMFVFGKNSTASSAPGNQVAGNLGVDPSTPVSNY